MTSLSPIETFRQHIVDDGSIMDPEGVHHGFVSGVHGQKLDFDKVSDGSELFGEWVDVSAHDINVHHLYLPRFVLGVANGTNRLALAVADRLTDISEGTEQVEGLVSAKDPDNRKRLFLPEVTLEAISAEEPELVVIVEDVGTRGTNSVQVAEQALLAGAKDVVVQVTWQRGIALTRLEERGVRYRAIIKEHLPDFEPEACRSAEDGFCRRGWQFVPWSSTQTT